MNVIFVYNFCMRFVNSLKDLDSQNYGSLNLLGFFMMYLVLFIILLLFYFRDIKIEVQRIE